MNNFIFKKTASATFKFLKTLHFSEPAWFSFYIILRSDKQIVKSILQLLNHTIGYPICENETNKFSES